MATRNFETGDKTLDRIIAVAPQSVEAHGLKALLAMYWKGDLSVAEKQFSWIAPENDPDGVMTWARTGFLILSRNYAEALHVVQRFRGETLVAANSAPVPKSFLEGTCYQKSRLALLPRARLQLERWPLGD